MAGADSAVSELSTAWMAFNSRWHATKAVWNDQVRREFEREFVTPLERQVRTTQREMENLAYAIQWAYRTVR